MPRAEPPQLPSHHDGVCTRLLHGSAKPPMLLLWSYLAYWAVIVFAKASDTDGTIWLTAFIISAIVGTGINAGAIGASPLCQYVSTGELLPPARTAPSAFASCHPNEKLPLRVGPFRCARFYAIPFCVSSLSSIATVNKSEFTYLFPKDLGLLMLALGVAMGWPTLIFGIDRVALSMERPPTNPGKAADGGLPSHSA